VFGRYRGERSRLAGAGVRHRVREQLDVVVVRGDYDRPSTACACQRSSRRQQRTAADTRAAAMGAEGLATRSVTALWSGNERAN